ncbi:MAG: transaldolase [Betaproteobacteria bacterium]|nr:transaldolase [Betaproteobacteria bacterium]
MSTGIRNHTTNATLADNPPLTLGSAGQSIWLDYIRRDLIESGGLAKMIATDGLVGMTSNPAIFERAVATDPAYQGWLRNFSGDRRNLKAAYEQLAIRDIRDAADALAPVYARTRGRDGYVSLEVSPDLAADTAGTIAEARRLWQAVGKPNLMIKVPGTPNGIPAIRALIALGLNVNVTLLFARSAYEAAAEAYIAGLEDRAKQGQSVTGIASVASFFVSRIDAAIDPQLNEIAKSGGPNAALATSLCGRIAIANAKVAYARYQELISAPRWQALAAAAARPQRLLWASTGTKNPAYRDVVYVEELIGADTVNTLPPATLNAFRDHGAVRASLNENMAAAHQALSDLSTLGISLESVTAGLLKDGVRQFEEAFVKLLESVERAINPR